MPSYEPIQLSELLGAMSFAKTLTGVLFENPFLFFVAVPTWLASVGLSAVSWRPGSPVGRRLTATRPLPSGWVVVLLVWAFGTVANAIALFADPPRAEGFWVHAWLLLYRDVVALIVVLGVSVVVWAVQHRIRGQRGLDTQAAVTAAILLATLPLLLAFVLIILAPLS